MEIGAIYGYAQFLGRDTLTEEELTRVNALAWKVTLLNAAYDMPRTGPYQTREEVISLIDRSSAAKVIGRAFIVREDAGTYAWYCDPILFQPRDVLLSTMEYDKQNWRWVECPIS